MGLHFERHWLAGWCCRCPGPNDGGPYLNPKTCSGIGQRRLCVTRTLPCKLVIWFGACCVGTDLYMVNYQGKDGVSSGSAVGCAPKLLQPSALLMGREA